MSVVKVRLQIESKQGDTLMRQSIMADVLRKGNVHYFRYPEPDEDQMGQTTTTVRVNPDEVRIFRHGEVSSNQTFIVDRKVPGFYHTSLVRLHLVTHTEMMEQEWRNGRPGRLGITYMLYIDGEASDRFELAIRIVEDGQ